MAQILTPGEAKQAVLFARLSAAAYLNTSVLGETGLKALKNEFRFNDKATDTQAVMGMWNNDVVIAFRGTEAKLSDWLATNAQVGLVKNSRGAGKVHTGFQASAKTAFPAVKKFLKNHMEDKSRVFLTGHSLGGALATLIGAWLENDKTTPNVRAIFTYGAPRVGDPDFVAQCRDAKLPKRTYPFVAMGDPVPKVAPFVFGYRHVTPSQYQLDKGSLGKTSLDRKAEIQTEDEWLDGIPGAKKLHWFASRVDDAITNVSTAAHSITGSYLNHIVKVSKSLS